MKNKVNLAKIIASTLVLVTIISVTFFITTTLVWAVDNWAGAPGPPPGDNQPGYIWNTFGLENSQPNADINIDGKATFKNIDVAGGSVISSEFCIPGSDPECVTAWDGINGGYWELADPNIYYIAGNVGIGTNEGLNSQGLLVVGTTAIIGRSIGLATAGSLGAPSIGVLAYANSSSYAVYALGGKNYFQGNVGIGTRSPAQKLDVAGNIKASGTICDGAGNCIESGGSLWETNGSKIYYNTDNVGIGTTAPAFKLHVTDRIKLDGSTAGAWIEAGATDWFVGRNGTNGSNLRFWNSNDKVVFTPAGNVGIGNTNPQEKLDVDGNIKASGTICDGDGNCITGGGSDPGDSLWDTNGSKIYYNAGNVGIGTNDPLRQFTIQGHEEENIGSSNPGGMVATLIRNTGLGRDSRAQVVLRTGSDIDDDYAGMTKWGENKTGGIVNSGPNALTLVNNSLGAPMGFWLNDSSDTLHEIMRLNANGQVSIGTATPAGDYKLTIASDTSHGVVVTNSQTGVKGYLAEGNRGVRGQTVSGYGVEGIASGTGWSGYFSGGNGAYIDKLCLGSTSNCKSSWSDGSLWTDAGSYIYNPGNTVKIYDNGSINIAPSNNASSFGSSWNIFGSLANSGAIYVHGDIYASGNKYFIQDHPTDPTKQIRYTALEGGESGTYARGSGQLVNGEARINLPEHFSLVTSEQGITVQITPTANTAGLYVTSKGTEYVVVKEINNGTGNATFDYLVQGIRKGYENKPVIVEKINLEPLADDESLEEELGEQVVGGQGVEPVAGNDEIVNTGGQQQPVGLAVAQPKLKWYQRLGNFFKNLFK